ncbi:MAG: glycosyltransferase [Candidatus Thalassarchaeaceae archaeon]|jgi:glycosyltransferase involved in cell wall biosynthesis|nr:glycosyltransferase [Candidatus Thalassarchaeaceae archaeon]MDP7043560.1 glycosyltransferase [Candidatus Thalassarchaeaceae archaeon]
MARVVAVVSNGCNPDPRVLREAGWLADAGHDVTIHAFDRLENLPKESHIDGVKIVRHSVGYTQYGGTWSTVRGLAKFRKAVIEAIDEIDLIHCHDADTLEIGLQVSKRSLAHDKSTIPVLFDMHDLHHTWVLMPKPNSLIRRFFAGRFRRKMLNQAAQATDIVTSSEGFQNWLAERGLESTVVQNRPPMRDSLPIAKKFTVGYLGRVREIESFRLLLEAVRLIPEDERPSLLIAGDGNAAVNVANMVRQANSDGWLDAEVIGAFISEQLPEMIAEISVMYAMYPPSRGNIMEGALPVKMFEAASFGRPSVVNSGCHMGEVCEAEGLGIATRWGDSQALADSLCKAHGTSVSLETDEVGEKERFLAIVANLL